MWESRFSPLRAEVGPIELIATNCIAVITASPKAAQFAHDPMASGRIVSILAQDTQAGMSFLLPDRRAATYRHVKCTSLAIDRFDWCDVVESTVGLERRDQQSGRWMIDLLEHRSAFAQAIEPVASADHVLGRV